MNITFNQDPVELPQTCMHDRIRIDRGPVTITISFTACEYHGIEKLHQHNPARWESCTPEQRHAVEEFKTSLFAAISQLREAFRSPA